MRALGIDTSNYTTSAAVFDGSGGYNAGRLLEVRPGELGLRQSDALFQHIKHLPGRFAELRAEGWLTGLSAVGASTRPRAVEGSYMPCFLAGEGQGQTLADALGVPFYAVSHQQGHIAAAAWSAGRLELLDRPMLAWHLSGGTTELLYVEPDGVNVRAQCVGGTSDISAGQLIDRTGVLLGLPFPAGKALDVLASESDLIRGFPLKPVSYTHLVFGMLAVLCMCVAPFLQLGIHYLTYKVTSALSATVSSGRVAGLIDQIGGAFGLVLGMTGASALLLLISMVSAITAVVR